MIRIKHKGEPKRESVWTWRIDRKGMVHWTINSYLDGYYQASASRDGVMIKEDFMANVESLKNLSPEVFEVKVY